MAIDFVLKRTTTSEPNLGIPWRQKGRLQDLDFADDIVMLDETQEGLQSLTSKLELNARKIGLKISSEKTKVMNVDNQRGQTTSLNIKVNDSSVQTVDHFTYLGSIVRNDCDIETDIACRIGKAASVFRRMRSIWSSNAINTEMKVRLHKSIVVPTAIYASETWKSTAKTKKMLNVFHQKCLRRILKITWRDRVTNDEVLRRTRTRPLSDSIVERRLRLAGHILRLPDIRPSKTAIKWIPQEGKRKRGRPKRTWRSTVIDDLSQVNITWQGAEAAAADRTGWRKVAAQCAYGHRRN